MHSVKSRARHLAWRGDGDDRHKYLAYFVPYAHRLGRTPSGNSMNRELIPKEADEPPPSKTRRPPQRPNACPIGDDIAEEYHSESCVAHEISSNQQPPRASTEPTPYSPTDLTHNGKQSTATSDTLFPASETPNGTIPLPQEERSQPKHRFPRLHKRKQGDTTEDGTPLARKPSKKKKKFPKKIPVEQQLRGIFWSWPNILLICVPVGIALNYAHVNPLAIFIVNFLAIIPLAGTLSYATEEIALRVGETLGGLLNATFGNATELIVSILALVKGEITIVQTSLVGSMLSNLLLVLGMCFVAGGYNRLEQNFNVTVAQTACSLLILAIGSLVIPTVFTQWSSADDGVTLSKIPQLSRGTAIILLFVYACYLFFQLKTHNLIYNAPSEKVAKKSLIRSDKTALNGSPAETGAASAIITRRDTNKEDVEQGSKRSDDDEEDAGDEVPTLSTTGALLTLIISTAFIGLCSEFVVESINYVSANNNVPLEFIGLILLPIVGNAAEHATAVTVAIKDKMDLSIGVAVGSSLQIALLLIPLSVIIGWIIGPVEDGTLREGVMTLNFDGFVIAVLFIAVLLVNYLIADGKSHWLEGVMLMSTYIIIAVASWFYPDPPGLREA